MWGERQERGGGGERHRNPVLKDNWLVINKSVRLRGKEKQRKELHKTHPLPLFSRYNVDVPVRAELCCNTERR